MLEDIRLAFQGIWNHKLRSALTMLGIIIGIGSIIAIVSTIKGTNEQIKKILVAEDVESNFILLKNLIGREYTLLWAKDGVEAIEMYKQYQPDLILMDVKMPRMDGLEATHIIRSYSKEIPIIALTAYAFGTDKEQALEMGCNDYVTNPISERSLRKALDKYSTTV